MKAICWNLQKQFAYNGNSILLISQQRWTFPQVFYIALMFNVYCTDIKGRLEAFSLAKVSLLTPQVEAWNADFSKHLHWSSMNIELRKNGYSGGVIVARKIKSASRVQIQIALITFSFAQINLRKVWDCPFVALSAIIALTGISKNG